MRRRRPGRAAQRAGGRVHRCPPPAHHPAAGHHPGHRERGRVHPVGPRGHLRLSLADAAECGPRRGPHSAACRPRRGRRLPVPSPPARPPLAGAFASREAARAMRTFAGIYAGTASLKTYIQTSPRAFRRVSAALTERARQVLTWPRPARRTTACAGLGRPGSGRPYAGHISRSVTGRRCGRKMISRPGGPNVPRWLPSVCTVGRDMLPSVISWLILPLLADCGCLPTRRAKLPASLSRICELRLLYAVNRGGRYDRLVRACRVCRARVSGAPGRSISESAMMRL